jgi:hypothetical protein
METRDQALAAGALPIVGSKGMSVVVIRRQQLVLVRLLVRGCKSVPVPGLLSGIVWPFEPGAPPTLASSEWANSADSALMFDTMSVFPACPSPALIGP